MEPQETYQGFSPSAYGAPPAYVPAPAPAPMLRPLSTGEILDRTLAMYRRHFWLFASIGMVPAVAITLTSMLRLIYLAVTHRVIGIAPGTVGSPDAVAAMMGSLVLLQAYFLPATLLFLVVYGVSHAATVDAVSHIAQGEPTGMGSAYRNVRGRWLRWTGIVFRQMWSSMWPGLAALSVGLLAFVPAIRGNQIVLGFLILAVLLLVMVCGVLGVINYLRMALATPAAVQENLGVNAAVRRSRALVAGRKGRIFLALLLVYALQMVAGAIQLPLILLATKARGAEHILLQAIQLVVGFVATTLVAPVASIALCLLYIDERVRREGYDIEVLMRRADPPSAVAVASPAAGA